MVFFFSLIHYLNISCTCLFPYCFLTHLSSAFCLCLRKDFAACCPCWVQPSLIYSSFLYMSIHGDPFASPNFSLVPPHTQCPSVTCPSRSGAFPCEVHPVKPCLWCPLLQEEQCQTWIWDAGNVPEAEHMALPWLGRCHLLTNISVTPIAAQEPPPCCCAPPDVFFWLSIISVLS